MKRTREQVVVLIAICMGINFFCLGSYILGYYRNVASSGIFYDIILGAESGVNMASDYMLFSVLQVPANPALSGPTPAQVVDTLRKFLMLNAGTIVVCCVGHVAGGHFLSRNVPVVGVRNADEESSKRNRSFLQRAICYIALAIVKTSGLTADPHEIVVRIADAFRDPSIVEAKCSCTAGLSQKCKHISAVSPGTLSWNIWCSCQSL
ncbi:uncharacterized protein [Dermacentor albipictus]|uniref:uncharacterized protein isoform X3 n=1 Tax=Dermacentor albipictus TaxID=60249 RepID=UPI0031FC1944